MEINLSTKQQQSNINGFWLWLTEPAISIENIALRRQMRLLSTLLLLMVGLSLSIHVAAVFFFPERPVPLLAVGAYLLAMAAYVLNRADYYDLAALLTVSIFPVTLFSLMFTNHLDQLAFALPFSIFGLLLATVLLSIPGIVMLSTINMIGIWLISKPFIGSSDFDTVASLLFYFTASVFLVTLMSHRKQIEEDRQVTLRDSQEHFSSLAEAVTSAIIIYQDSQIRYVNAATELLTGCRREELLGLNFWQMIHPDYRALVQEQDHEAPARYELKFLTKDGQARWVDYTTSAIEFNGQPAILGTAFDITERKETEEALQVSLELIERAKQEWEGTADSLPQLVYLLNNERCVLRANRTVERWGVGKVINIKGIEAHDVLHPNCIDPECYLANFWDHAWQELERGRSVECEAKDPILKRHLYIQVRPISTQTDKRYKATTSFAVAVIHDITKRKRAEEKIQASLKEKEVMLKEIHHRVKNNLQIISSLLYLQSKEIEDQKALEVFRESQSRVKSMALIHDKLYQSTHLAKINFAEYIHNLAHYLSQTYRLLQPIAFKIQTDEVFLTIDTAIPCGLIINELVSNALKYAFSTYEKGEIRINLHVHSHDGVEDQLELVVADNGQGIPEHIDFRKTRTLGLQLVNKLVKQLNGTLELNRADLPLNGKNCGTEFRITFSEPKDKQEG